MNSDKKLGYKYFSFNYICKLIATNWRKFENSNNEQATPKQKKRKQGCNVVLEWASPRPQKNMLCYWKQKQLEALKQNGGNRKSKGYYVNLHRKIIYWMSKKTKIEKNLNDFNWKSISLAQ